MLQKGDDSHSPSMNKEAEGPEPSEFGEQGRNASWAAQDGTTSTGSKKDEDNVQRELENGSGMKWSRASGSGWTGKSDSASQLRKDKDNSANAAEILENENELKCLCVDLAAYTESGKVFIVSLVGEVIAAFSSFVLLGVLFLRCQEPVPLTNDQDVQNIVADIQRLAVSFEPFLSMENICVDSANPDKLADVLSRFDAVSKMTHCFRTGNMLHQAAVIVIMQVTAVTSLSRVKAFASTIPQSCLNRDSLIQVVDGEHAIHTEGAELRLKTCIEGEKAELSGYSHGVSEFKDLYTLLRNVTFLSDVTLDRGVGFSCMKFRNASGVFILHDPREHVIKTRMARLLNTLVVDNIRMEEYDNCQAKINLTGEELAVVCMYCAHLLAVIALVCFVLGGLWTSAILCAFLTQLFDFVGIILKVVVYFNGDKVNLMSSFFVILLVFMEIYVTVYICVGIYKRYKNSGRNKGG